MILIAIDALAKAVNEFAGGMVLVSHDMRLISQVAKEIWICDEKTITTYKGDIMNFKMDMRNQLGIDNENNSKGQHKLKGDASVKATDKPKTKAVPKKVEPKLEVIKPVASKTNPTTTIFEEGPPFMSVEPIRLSLAKVDMAAADDATTVTTSTATSGNSGGGSGSVLSASTTLPTTSSSTNNPAAAATATAAGGDAAPKRYIPPHLRKKMAQEGN
jgi:hypothetical protein